MYMCVKMYVYGLFSFLVHLTSEQEICANSSQLWNYPSETGVVTSSHSACVRADQAQGVLALLGELVNSNFVWAGGVRHFAQMGNDWA